jgi:hypothetical protein
MAGSRSFPGDLEMLHVAVRCEHIGIQFPVMDSHRELTEPGISPTCGLTTGTAALTRGRGPNTLAITVLEDALTGSVRNRRDAYHCYS